MTAKKCNVLILENSLGMGGVERLLYDFTRLVDRERFHLTVCCLKEGGHYKEPIERLGIPFYDHVLSNRFDFFAFRKLKPIIAKHGIDVILTFAHPNTVILSDRAKSKRLVKGFSVWYHAFSGEGRPLVPRFLRYYLSHADDIVALSQLHKRILVDNGLPETLIDIVHNGVDVERFRPGQSNDDLTKDLGIKAGEGVVTMVGTLSASKGKRYDVLLDAMARVRDRVANARAILVGDGPDRPALERQAESLGLSEHVTFTGIRNDVDEILRLTDVFVLSSQREAFPVSVLEAMATGVPVIASDAGSTSELVIEAETGFVVPVGDATALAEAISRVLSNHELASRLGRRGRDVVASNYRIEHMTRRYEEIISRPMRNL